MSLWTLPYRDNAEHWSEARHPALSCDRTFAKGFGKQSGLCRAEFLIPNS